MGLFDEKEKTIKENYVRVLDILEKLYEKSDQGWFEVLHFLKNSSIGSITTYSCDDGVIPEVRICNEVPIEKVYENGYRLGQLKDALCAFIANNCDSLDGEHLENKIIAESEFIKQFKQYVWLKNDIQGLEEFKTLNLIELIEMGRPLKSEQKSTNIVDAIHQKNQKYRELIFCIENFTGKFNRSLEMVGDFLIKTKFYKHCDVYVRIGDDEVIKLNKINSEKSISFVLEFLDDKKFNTTDLGFDADYFHLNHILIDEDDLLYFEPLKDLIVDIKMGHTLYENIKYGDIRLNKLGTFEEYYYQETDKFFSEKWKRLKNTEIEQEPSIESHRFNINTHPSLDPNHPNHAPELLLAIQAWEAKYLKNEYPHQEHTPAIETILKNNGIENSRLKARIAAITNPNKKKIINI